MSECKHQWIKVGEKQVVWDKKQSLWRESDKDDFGKWLDNQIDLALAYSVICPNCETSKEFIPTPDKSNKEKL